ncbi:MULTISPECIES: phage tail length tape measure family protein [unclassified Mesorhizobium]|uniref:phage tail length tape measure family protein n=1 Tax=unclassified Mesorhizobium TaxID=325217 RepID=UPI0033390AE4
MDVATIGFKADTSELVAAKSKMEALAPAATKLARASDQVTASVGAAGGAAQRAATGVTELKTANAAAAGAINTKRTAVVAAAAADTRAAGAAEAAAAATMAQGEAADAAAAKLLKMRSAANQNSASLGAMKANTANIAAQFQDIGVTAAMGMNPLQIALQQGTQLSSVFASMKPAEAVKALGAAFGALFGVVSLATIGIVAIIAALVQFVNWASFAKGALTAFADILPTIAPYAATIGAVLAVAFGPAIAASIWAVAGAIVDGLMAAIIAIVATIGAVPILIGAVIAGLFIFRDEIKGVLGVDLIDLVKGAINGMIGGFIGGYRAIVAVWSLLPGAMKDLAYQAGNALIKGIEFGVNAAISMVTGLYNKIADLAHAQHIELSVEIPKLSNPNAGAAAGVLADATAAAKSAAGVDYVGQAYDFVGNMAEKAAGKVRGLADAIDLTDATKKKKHGGGKTDAEKFSDIVNGAERSIASLQAERDAIGMTAEATAKLKYETQLLNEAKQKGIDLSPTQRAQLMGLANDMASLEVQTKKVQEAFDFAKDLTKGFFSDFEQGIVNGEGFWKSFGDAALNALNKIVDKLLNDVIDALFQVNSAAVGGSGGGFLGMLGSVFGSVFGGGSDPGIISALGLAHGGSFGSEGMSKFAKGGDFTNSIVSRSTPFSFANGTALGEMGEAGPEAIMPLKRMGNGDMGVAAIMPGNGAANQNSGPQRPGTLRVDVSGARGNAEIQEMVRQGVEAGLDQYDTYALPARVNQIAADPRGR